jgi:lipoprotein NlpD
MAAGCASEPAIAPNTYVVQPRDTLYSIAWRHDLDYRDLAKWNHIGADYRISVGQVLMLKPADYRARPSAAHRSSAAANSARSGGSGGAGVGGEGGSNAAPPSKPGQPCGTVTQHWMWPTAHASAPRPVPGGGILLLGALGQPIRAACGGRVVYAGSGIRGYGNLIIIKHADTVLSAYAHTVEPRVHEGEEVSAGQEIARMGTGPHDIAALYFEIRLNGKPVDPLPFLPVGAN